MAATDKPYIFISYAHADSAVVLPTIEAMKAKGINLWYDEGIEAGSEWPEYIAEKVMHCSKFLLFISNSYLNSQNCKRELNFAISRKKDILSIYLEDVSLSPGMEMQLGTYQAIFRRRFTDDTAFRRSLCDEQFFKSCIGAPAVTVPSASATPSKNNDTVSSFEAARASFTQQQSGRTTPPPDFTATQTTTPPPQPIYSTAPIFDVNAANLPVKSKLVAAILAILFGSFGIHKFYLGKKGLGIVYLLFFWTYIPGILSFIEGIIILASSDENFQQKYRCRIK